MRCTISPRCTTVTTSSRRDDVLDLERRQVVDRVVETDLVALEGLQGLVGAVEQTPDLLELSFEPAGVDVDHAHLLRRRHDRHVERPGDPFSSAMPRAGLARRHRGVGDEVDVRPSDAPAVVGDDDRAVHLGEFGHTLGAERSVDQEATRADRQHLGVVGQHDQCAGLGTNDSIDAVAQRGAWTDPRQGVAHRVVGAPVPTVHGDLSRRRSAPTRHDPRRCDHDVERGLHRGMFGHETIVGNRWSRASAEESGEESAGLMRSTARRDLDHAVTRALGQRRRTCERHARRHGVGGRTGPTWARPRAGSARSRS